MPRVAKWSIADSQGARVGEWCTFDFEDEDDDEDDFEGEVRRGPLFLLVMRGALEAAVGDGFGGGRGA